MFMPLYKSCLWRQTAILLFLCSSLSTGCKSAGKTGGERPAATGSEVATGQIIEKSKHGTVPDIDSTDYNFDNRPDLGILDREKSGPTNTVRTIYIYDPAKKQYLLHEELSEMGNVYADRETRTIVSFWGMGGVGMYDRREYEWNKDRLRLIRREVSDRLDSIGIIIVKTDSLRNGVWESRTDTLTW